ncbi:S8 family serine peptidase [Planosporangium thailandense]|uniref:S8 family serine peptidase n=1 Tax=Planosporangium thailandense TaxID=765197 RepID=UPI0030B801CC
MAAGLTGAGVAAAAPPDGAIVNADAADAVKNSYIVEFKAGSAESRAVDSSAGKLARAYGGSVRHSYKSTVKGFSVTMSEQAAKRLAANPAVARVEQNRTVTATDTQTNADWNLDRIDHPSTFATDNLHNDYTYPNTAANVHAYIIDSGIRTTHHDFGGRSVFGYNAIGGPNDDCFGHGSHVAGTVGGARVGVAKGVQLVSVKVLDCTGKGTVDAVIAGVEWVTAHAIKPAVANMSLGGDPDPALDNAVAASIASGITYTVAAGNDSANACNYSPARVPGAITVGASGIGDGRASFSNYGTCVDLFAPGTYISSVYYLDDWSFVQDQGTSMASPHAAGAAAIYLQAHPTATPAQVRNSLITYASAGVIGDAGPGSPNRLLNVTINQGAGPVGSGNPPGGVGAAQIPGVEPSRVKADFDGDGRDDVALFYDYGNGYVSLWTLTALPGGGFATPVLRWYDEHWGRGTKFVTAGDFNGDGKADLALFYDYGNGHVTLFTLTATGNGDGGFSGPVPRWDKAVWGTRTKFVTTGDFNGDGKTDVGLFYDYGNGHVTLFTLTATSNGFGDFTSVTSRWDAPYWGTGTKFLTTGDFNGDGKTDVGLFYDYGNGHVTLFTLTATGSGAVGSFASRWDAPYWGSGTRAML